MQAHYVSGSVFTRSPEYYLQQLSTVRRRSPNRYQQKINKSIQQSQPQILKSVSQNYQPPISTFTPVYTPSFISISIPPVPSIPPTLSIPPPSSSIPAASTIPPTPNYCTQLQQNLHLRKQLHKAFLQNPSYKKLSQQNQELQKLYSKRCGNEKEIGRLESIRAQIQARFRNVIQVDQQVKKNLDSLENGTLRKMYLVAAKQALERGEDRETVSVILRNIL